MTKHRSSNLRIACLLSVGLALLTTALWGAGFWDKKDFTQWNAKEIDRVLRNSPWAKMVSVTMGAPTNAFSGGGGGGRRGDGGAPGGGAPGGGAPGGGGGRRGGAGGGGGGGMQAPPAIPLLIRFAQAMPVKHAIIKSHMGESTEPTPEMQKFLDNREPYYVVAVLGLPRQLERYAETPERFVQTARLRRKGKEDILPQRAEVEASQQGDIIFMYYFPRDAPIEVADKEVEFYMKLERPSGPRGGAGGPNARGGQRQGGQQGQGRAQGGQQGQGRAQGGQQGGGPGAGQRGAAGGARAMALMGKEIKRKFRLKDMMYNGELAM